MSVKKRVVRSVTPKKSIRTSDHVTAYANYASFAHTLYDDYVEFGTSEMIEGTGTNVVRVTVCMSPGFAKELVRVLTEAIASGHKWRKERAAIQAA